MLRSSTMVGGDFFDILPDGRALAVAVGDVSGKGIPAALLMVMVRTLLREIARGLPEPAEVLTRLNASLCRDMPPSMFVTLVLAVLDPPGDPGAWCWRAAATRTRCSCARTGAAVRLGRRGGRHRARACSTRPRSGRPSSTWRAAATASCCLTDGIMEAPERGRHAARHLGRVLPILERERALSAQAAGRPA